MKLSNFVKYLIFFFIIGCDDSGFLGSWNVKNDNGFFIEHVEISDVSIECKQGEYGNKKTYFVPCFLKAKIIYSPKYIFLNKVAILSKLIPLDKISKVEYQSLNNDELFRPKGNSDPDYLGQTYSAYIQSVIKPLFTLDIWGNTGDRQKIEDIEVKFKLSISATKCEKLIFGNHSKIFCFDFGGK